MRSSWTCRSRDPQVPAFVNSSWPNTVSAVRDGHRLPARPGGREERRRLPAARDHRARKARIVWPHEGAPVTMCTSHCSNEIVEAMVKALAQCLPGSRDGRLGPALPRGDQGQRCAAAGPALRVAPVPCAARRRRVVAGRWLVHRGRMAFGRRAEIRQRRDGGGALPAVLREARIPPRQRGRRHAIAAASAASWCCGSRPTARPWRTPPATACGTARRGCWAGEDGGAAPLHAATARMARRAT